MRKLFRPALCAIICLSAAFAVSDSEVVEGNPRSAVKVTIYDDMQCAPCAAFRAALDEKLLPKYGSMVAFVYRDFPQPKHDWARPAAIAARWLHEQQPSLSAKFRQELMPEQERMTLESLKAWMAEFARRNKIDEQQFLASLDDQRLSQIVDQDIQAARARGVKGVPAVYVHGQVYTGIIIPDEVARAIDAELSR